MVSGRRTGKRFVNKDNQSAVRFKFALRQTYRKATQHARKTLRRLPFPRRPPVSSSLHTFRDFEACSGRETSCLFHVLFSRHRATQQLAHVSRHRNVQRTVDRLHLSHPVSPSAGIQQLAHVSRPRNVQRTGDQLRLSHPVSPSADSSKRHLRGCLPIFAG